MKLNSVFHAESKTVEEVTLDEVKVRLRTDKGKPREMESLQSPKCSKE